LAPEVTQMSHQKIHFSIFRALAPEVVTRGSKHAEPVEQHMAFLATGQTAHDFLVSWELNPHMSGPWLHRWPKRPLGNWRITQTFQHYGLKHELQNSPLRDWGWVGWGWVGVGLGLGWGGVGAWAWVPGQGPGPGPGPRTQGPRDERARDSLKVQTTTRYKQNKVQTQTPR
jgi:hypothetical protein